MYAQTLSPKEAWQTTLGQLQLHLSKPSFDTWLKGSEVLAYEDGEFAIRVPHAYAKDWLESHLDALITRTLGNVFGRTVQVNYVVHLRNRETITPEPGTLFESLAVTGSQIQDQDKSSTDTTHSPSPAAKSDETPAGTPPDESPPALPTLIRPDYSEWDPRFNTIHHTTTMTRPPAKRVKFDERYTLDTYITGPSNTFAFAAAQAVVDAPGKTYNPLVIYGGSGLGKTHLLHAIGQASQDAGKYVQYVTGEAFTNELVEAIRDQTTAGLRDRYRHVDVLLVDDVQFIAGKARTEEEFYHTFNTLFSQGKQIVITCNQHPREIKKLDDRLSSRLQGGLLTDIQPPELETRLAILRAKSLAQGNTLPDEVATVLANHETSNVRALEGLLTQVIARATLTRQPLTLALAQQALQLKDGPAPFRRRATRIEDILKAAAAYHQLSMDDVMSTRRTKDVVLARQVVMYLAREETDASLNQIGEALGGRNHSTVLHGYQKIADKVEQDDDLKQEVNTIRHQLRLFPDD
ncbi:MAG: chromosomal replication initiator protein DnaA [Anaerolineae bacterium]|nr:chromosomal replication initiator protein DnaA [Anaerolineae bacterium]